ncbi:uncharacterized protein [Procambarus clarkii]|uniref:uncharacterized protein n=1 Tax=Procambarus clarkii TaxID=6728 RepID=UPI0037429F11
MWKPLSCCCFKLRTGSLIIGFLSMIRAVLKIVCWIIFAILMTNYILQSCSQQTYSEDSDMCAEQILNIIYGIVAFGVVTSVIQLVLSIIFICGIFKNKSCLLIPYMIMCLISIIILILIALAIIILVSLYLPGWFLFIIIILFAPWIFWKTFLLLVIRAHYLEMKRENPGHIG